jgi:hypothetical protein
MAIFAICVLIFGSLGLLTLGLCRAAASESRVIESQSAEIIDLEHHRAKPVELPQARILRSGRG